MWDGGFVLKKRSAPCVSLNSHGYQEAQVPISPPIAALNQSFSGRVIWIGALVVFLGWLSKNRESKPTRQLPRNCLFGLVVWWPRRGLPFTLYKNKGFKSKLPSHQSKPKIQGYLKLRGCLTIAFGCKKQHEPKRPADVHTPLPKGEKYPF